MEDNSNIIDSSKEDTINSVPSDPELPPLPPLPSLPLSGDELMEEDEIDEEDEISIEEEQDEQEDELQALINRRRIMEDFYSSIGFPTSMFGTLLN